MRTSIHTAHHLMEATGHRAYQDRQTVAQTSSWIAAVGVTMETYYYVRYSQDAAADARVAHCVALTFNSRRRRQ